MQFRKFLACPVMVFALMACTAHKVQTIDPGVTRHTSLSFLKDGQTTKKEVRSKLESSPSAQFEDGRIFTYRLDGKYQAVQRPSGQSPTPWHRAQYSLVLVFDAAGILQRHSLVRVR